MFVDDRKENVLAARSCGLSGCIYNARDPTRELERVLRNALFDPISRAQNFLVARQGQLGTYLDDGRPIAENFAQLLILEVTQDKSVHTISFLMGTELE
jgi:hypothetical protein